MKFTFLILIFMAYIPIFMVVMSQLKPTSVRFTGLLISKASAGSQRTCSRRETSVNVKFLGGSNTGPNRS